MPDAPIAYPIGGSRWDEFDLSGITGGDSESMNGGYRWDEIEMDFVHEGGTGALFEGEAGSWQLKNPGGVTVSNGSAGVWPWECTWSALTGGLAGELDFTRRLPLPTSITVEGDDPEATAELTTALTGTNNDLLFIAVFAGPLGNAISIRYVNPGTNNAALSVAVVDFAITVNLATDGSAAITSTAALVNAAIEANEDASALIGVDNAAGNNGTGVVTAMSETFLTGGSGPANPLPPVTLTI